MPSNGSSVPPAVFIIGGIYLAIVVAAIVADVRIIKRAGYSGWWMLTAIVPLVNLVMFFVFAFKEWPIQRELQELRAMAAGQGYPGQGGYPGSTGGYPQAPGSGYPQASGGGYPQAQGGGYPQAQGGGYPQTPGGGYPQNPGGGYPPAPGSGYPQGPGGGYPGN